MEPLATDFAARRRARFAYELGRLRLGMFPAFVAVAMTGVSFIMDSDVWLAAGVGSSLLALALVLTSLGGVYGRSVMPGLLAGTAPLVFPLALRSWGHCCSGGSCYSFCLAGCVSGGLVAGFALGKIAISERRRFAFLGSASLFAAGLGLLGCGMAGAAGMAGMALAIALSSLPVVALAPRVPLGG